MGSEAGKGVFWVVLRALQSCSLQLYQSKQKGFNQIIRLK